MRSQTWRLLRRRPAFWASAAILLVILLMAAVPAAFTRVDPTDCTLDRSIRPPSGTAWFGYDFQGCDVFARTVHGARSSILVGVLATLLAGLIAAAVGLTAGYVGGWLDALLSRLTDIVLGIPLLLAAIVLLHRATASGAAHGVWPVVATLGILGWTTAARVVRSSVLAARQQDYVLAARMLGAGHRRILLRHIVPNAVGPALVVLTITLGTFVASEATLSFLGIGLRAPDISWGGDIFSAQPRLRQAWWPLIWPSTFLALTVLAFIMLGDAIRDAVDPRSR
jgi:peptide/nickel transport system permease protein/oligopeptide transport system permease protein